MTEQEKWKIVQQYVFEKRKERNIIPKDELPHELSCEAYGEFYSLVEVKLMCTDLYKGAWDQLRDPEILHGAYFYVKERISSRIAERVSSVRADALFFAIMVFLYAYHTKQQSRRTKKRSRSLSSKGFEKK